MNRLSTLAILLLGAACTVHPEGEDQERARAEAAGAAWQRPFGERTPPPLRAESPLPEWIAWAEQQNGDLEAAWQRWIAALEQVPQDGTQSSTAMIGVEHTLDGGSALDRTGLSLMSDAMNNLIAPGRLGAQATAALQRARTAAAEFDRARLRLQRDVAEAWYTLAEHDETNQLLVRQRQLLNDTLPTVEARVQAGTGSPTARLLVQIALDRLDAERERMHVERPSLLAALRRTAGAAIGIDEALPQLPPLEPIRAAEQALVERALDANPELQVRRRECEAALAELTAREWRRVPELSVSSLLMGDGAVRLGAAVSLPFLRSTAVEGAIAQSSALARAAEAMRRQGTADATAAAVATLAELRGQEQEAKVLQERLLPHLRELLRAAEAEWTAGGGDFGMLTDAQTQTLETERALLRIRREHAIARARLGEATGELLTTPAPLR